MTITTGGTAVHLAPTVTKTFFKHYYNKAKRSWKRQEGRKMQATDELMFDEAFQIVRRFISLGTSDTVEAIQNFTDASPPPIPWATTLPVMVPMESCDRAAKIIIEHLGPQDLEKLVGGEKWWQLRGIPGVQAEWIAMSTDWKKMKKMEKEKGASSSQAASTATKTTKAKQKLTARRRDKRHERTMSEIRKMSSRAESAVRRSASLHRRRGGRSRSRSRSRSVSQSRNRSQTRASQQTGRDADADPPGSSSANETTDNSTADDGASNFTGAAEREELDRLQRVMLYFHGGGYYFGSLATHRYQIVRYARKFGGKCFAPVYRKAPQYPWPCALQDAVASYLYLIDPPADAKHSAIDPSKIVIAGDSAGGGLTLALLTVIRDMNLPAPAGAVLISPWCDLTHSFPSILENTETDIIPPYGFIHKPSTLWPINSTRPASETGNGNPDRDSDANKDEPRRKVPVGVDDQTDTADSDGQQHHDGNTESAARRSFQPSSEGEAGAERPKTAEKSTDADKVAEQSNKEPNGESAAQKNKGVPRAPDLLWSDPLKIRCTDTVHGDEIELREQIQLYATNDQLMHPLCSAVLSGSLGGLPPLFILAGDSEVLRDEIVYLAHRAAHPENYPLRHDLLDHSSRNRDSAARFDASPTKVHLQIYDQMCHVLTAFAFTSQSRFAYRAVASFVKHVTGAPTSIKNPFPQAVEGENRNRPDNPSDVDSDQDDAQVASPPQGSLAASGSGSQASSAAAAAGLAALSPFPSAASAGDVIARGDSQTKLGRLDMSALAVSGPEVDSPMHLSAQPSGAATPMERGQSTASTSSTSAGGKGGGGGGGSGSHGSGAAAQEASGAASSRHGTTGSGLRSRRGTSGGAGTGGGGGRSRSDTGDVKNEYAGQVPLTRPSFQSFMIRERVDVEGFLRPLEPESDLSALQMPPDEVGVIKQGPVARYLDGQEIWAKRYDKVARKVERRRAENERVAAAMLREAAELGLLDIEGLRKRVLSQTQTQRQMEGQGQEEASVIRSNASSATSVTSTTEANGAESYRQLWGWQVDFGPMDLRGETPPPASIAGRRDTESALALLKHHLQIRAKAYCVSLKHAKLLRHHSSLFSSSSSSTATGWGWGWTGNKETKDAEELAARPAEEGAEKRHGLRFWNLLMVRGNPIPSAKTMPEPATAK
ncbi:alpha/beta-hydrolase [Testicularia cyperi]|uniref:Alpha/beta-hydrolase n=1 Tax=Testicularia cyperi TaxID=1882483 RepID=A0A317XT38_9BASI|nr:alpha/beta-hydrolase [Testicularia cyperi]